MVETGIAIEQDALRVSPQGVDAALRADEAFCARLQLPSAQELDQIKRLSFDAVSLKETLALSESDVKESFRFQRDRLLRRYDKYRNSTTYLNRLATLSQLAGDSDKANEIFNEALTLDEDPFFSRKIFVSFFANSNFEGAERTLLAHSMGRHGETDLMRAYLMLQRNEVSHSRKLLDIPLQQEAIDPNVYTLAGVLELAVGAAQKAVQYFRAAIKQRPSTAPLYVNLAIAYELLNEDQKAIDSLRRAVAINPIYQNSVLFYCDVLFRDKRHREAVRVLREYLRYEQKDINAWDRLARALYELEDYKEALDALKHRAGLLGNADAWNNIASVYWRLKDTRRAYQYYVKALEALKQEPVMNWIPVANFMGFLWDQAEYAEIQRIVGALLSNFTLTQLAVTEQSSTICGYYIQAIAELGLHDEAEHLALELLMKMDVPGRLHYQLVVFITYFYSVVKYDVDRMLEFCEQTIADLNEIEYPAETSRGVLINNIVYSFLELDKMERAEQLLPQMSELLHKDAGVTATFGLFHLRKGRIGKGKVLYREAMHLARNTQLRTKLKQKLDLELGRALLQAGSIGPAQKYFSRVIAVKGGSKHFAAQATQLMKPL